MAAQPASIMLQAQVSAVALWAAPPSISNVIAKSLLSGSRSIVTIVGRWPPAATSKRKASSMRAHFHSFRARALLACVPATAIVLMGAAGTASAAHRPANSRAELRTALQHLLAGWHPSTHGAHWASLRGTGLKQVTRSNWSGYADDNSTGNTYASVTGKWKQPTVTNCTTTGPTKAVMFF